ncbi:MAG: dihydroneopterin aldolase [Bacteroidota bacterium]
MVNIAVEGVKIFAYHGVYAEEREKGTLFLVDVYMDAEVDQALYSDQLEDTIDYKSVYDIVEGVLSVPVHLLEKLAGEIGHAVLERHKQVKKVRVRVSKIKPLAMSLCERTYVEAKFGWVAGKIEVM